MNNRDWEIIIRPGGVSVKIQNTRDLYDADGNLVHVRERPQYSAISASSFATSELFREHINTLLNDKYGGMIAHVIAQSSENDERAKVASNRADVAEKRASAVEAKWDRWKEVHGSIDEDGENPKPGRPRS